MTSPSMYFAEFKKDISIESEESDTVQFDLDLGDITWDQSYDTPLNYQEYVNLNMIPL